MQRNRLIQRIFIHQEYKCCLYTKYAYEAFKSGQIYQFLFLLLLEGQRISKQELNYSWGFCFKSWLTSLTSEITLLPLKLSWRTRLALQSECTRYGIPCSSLTSNMFLGGFLPPGYQPSSTQLSLHNL